MEGANETGETMLGGHGGGAALAAQIAVTAIEICLDAEIGP